ncbi:MAG TPA: GNAT family acetyltransferase, partial [Leptospiraceae bacterium]|nr:GNAT family acetyltransferase [Leptospiraceae bacterium]
MIIREFQFEDADMVIELWKQCGLLRPWNHPILDIKRKQTRDRDLFLVGVESEKIVASVMGGYEGHRGWINYLAVDLSMRKKGFGRMILEEVERRLKEKGAPKINLQ